jgi:hypothetical protein
MNLIRPAAILLALVTSACSAGTVSPSAVPSSSPAATTSATPLASPSLLQEGTYRTAPIPTATLQAAAEAAGLTWDAVTPDGHNMATDLKNVTTTVYTIRLLNGRWTWFCAFDGATDELCAQGTYKVTDDHTVAYTDAEDPSSGFILTFSLEGDVLTTHIDPGPGAGIEAVIFYNSAPFVRQP